jgi:hypothetical protein
VELGAYAGPEEVAADLRLVLDMAVQLSPAGSKLQQVARRLAARVMDGIDRPSTEKPANGSGVGGGGAEALSLKNGANLKLVRGLLERMMKRPQNHYFLEPVDPEEDGCEDYLDIIQEPMDLGTIKDYLDSSAFETVAEFADHVRLMCRNALTYNPDNSPVHRAATECLQACSRIQIPAPHRSGGDASACARTIPRCLQVVRAFVIRKEMEMDVDIVG